ncbi:MAG: sugar ABC transporter substrate-binding protein [Herpetosiphon sp.]
MKQSYRSIGALMVLAVVLAACGQSAGTGNTTSGTSAPAKTAAQGAPVATSAAATKPAGGAATAAAAPAAGDKVKITYGLWDQTQQAGVQKVIDAFEKANPNVHVEIQLTPWSQYWDNLKTAAAGGDLFDVFWMNGPFFPFYASKGILLDLQPYMDKDKFEPAKYPQTILDLYKYQGKYYAGPRDFDTIGLYYNKDMFDKAGIAYPDESWDWNKLRAVAKQLTKAPDQFGFVSWWSGQEETFNFVFSNGGNILKDKQCALDQKPAVEAIQFLVDLIYKDKVSEQPAAMGEDPTTFFQQGKAAMMTTGSWNVNAYKKSITGFKWDVAPLPKAPTGQRVSVIHGLGNAVSAKTKHPEQAWAFVKYIASKEGQDILASSGTQIPTYEGLAKPWQDANKEVKTQVFLDAAKSAQHYPSSLSFSVWNSSLGKGMTEIFNNAVPVEEGLKKICAEINNATKND